MSALPYNEHMPPVARIRLLPGTLSAAMGQLVREVRLDIGWSQEELADRAGTSQATVSRIERATSDPDLAVLDRVLTALGLRTTLEIEGRHLADRADQRDPVHAALTTAIAGRLTRCGWAVATEVPIGRASPIGWIDLLGFRRRDAALLITEIKADLPDVGGLQRQVALYEHEGPLAARRLGWQPARVALLVVCLDSSTVDAQLRAHHPVLAPAFPGEARTLAAWIRQPGAALPPSRTVARTDLARRRGLALHPAWPHRRSAPPVYRDYADAAALLATRRPATGLRMRRRGS